MQRRAIKIVTSFFKKTVGAILALLLCMNSFALPFGQSDLEARRKLLKDLLAEQWEYTLSTVSGTYPSRNLSQESKLDGDRQPNYQFSEHSSRFFPALNGGALSGRIER